MILTITLNPSMDHSYLTETFSLGKMTRFDNPYISIGGKGINAGRVSALSGSEVILAGFLGGNNGHLIQEILQAEDRYQLEFLPIDGVSRNAITIMHDNDAHTEIVEKGPLVTPHAEQKLYDHLTHLLSTQPIEVICVSGSVNTEDPDFYSHLLDHLRKLTSADFPILMDVSGLQLLRLLQNQKNRPTLIKPNLHELTELIEQEDLTKKQVSIILESTLFKNIDIVMVSCGGDGAVIKVNDRLFEVELPKIKIVNTTGCGDATVGGAAYAMSQNFSIEETIKYAMACGMSNATFKTNGMIDQLQVEQFVSAISIKEKQLI